MSRLTRDGTAEPVSRDQILRRCEQRGKGNIRFPCSADHDQDYWQPYQVDHLLLLVHICDDYTHIHTLIMRTCLWLTSMKQACLHILGHGSADGTKCYLLTV